MEKHCLKADLTCFSNRAMGDVERQGIFRVQIWQSVKLLHSFIHCIHFNKKRMVARTQLAALDHNENVKGAQATNKKDNFYFHNRHFCDEMCG